ncbi:aspartate aminotransferase family protein [Herbiconiux sp. KACC 21604]|uniref:aspartate aminotransferase family protein n=1 Tax=unclassified Herbiconiux TaxID=2618217 RepID=UPI00149249F2|nr:aspartate aminotransferase family protein [Herbiconiux sp. SALV-R1]QJU54048.1 aspartate aminotransferase family protein [Herbiconiux sp. SALV-R1]WPO85089.1 aspartate aminotransferase family protein [Herbiconiux sp. KACC 21604]
MSTDSNDQQLTRELDRAHVFHSWSAQGALNPMVIAGGLGSTVWDFEGNEYLDFSSQLVNTNIGHQHPAVVAAIKEQADVLTTVAPAHANLTRGKAAQKILEKAGSSFSKVFFTNGGADANENAIRMARLHTGRDKVLSTYRSYHGNTGAAVVATGDWRRVPNEYSRGHVHFFGPFSYRSEFWSESPEQESERALHHLRRVIQAEGPASIAAILLETIPGTAGVIVPPPGYLAGVRELADEYGIVLIFDEVMAGFGRTGGWFAFQSLAEDGVVVQPDLITFAKGVNSGYVPAGGVIISPAIAEQFDDAVFPGGLTYSGHPLAMAAIVGTIDAMESEGIVANAERIGRDKLAPGLAALAEKYELIGEVRGLGVFWALDLVTDRETREPAPASVVGALKAALLERGLLPFFADNRLHVVPPCIVTDAEVDRALAIYDEAFASLASPAP